MKRRRRSFLLPTMDPNRSVSSTTLLEGTTRRLKGLLADLSVGGTLRFGLKGETMLD
jgi:hypothetical protein